MSVKQARTLTHLIMTYGLDVGAGGGCGLKWPDREDWRRSGTTFHPNAPVGVSTCSVCGRIVVRGLGNWWDQ